MVHQLLPQQSLQRRPQLKLQVSLLQWKPLICLLLHQELPPKPKHPNLKPRKQVCLRKLPNQLNLLKLPNLPRVLSRNWGKLLCLLSRSRRLLSGLRLSRRTWARLQRKERFPEPQLLQSLRFSRSPSLSKDPKPPRRFLSHLCQQVMLLLQQPSLSPRRPPRPNRKSSPRKQGNQRSRNLERLLLIKPTLKVLLTCSRLQQRKYLPKPLKSKFQVPNLLQPRNLQRKGFPKTSLTLPHTSACPSEHP